MNRVDDKVAIVSGGGSGIGRASSILLAQAGARVVVTDIDQAAAEQTVEEIISSGCEAIS
ncbi:MAG: SDR family NAD(P)-dependent oxidoreductase, partial [Pseudomonadales bacterium]|nr:SDR family NAD(P)-dependent oxidoreductase [Pseudomonadales bacterium]